MRKLFFCTSLSLSLLLGSCLGSFNAVVGLKQWNDGVSDSKFVNNLLFWGMNIIPVYGLFAFGDVFIFNVIEFWSGSNPIAMNDGDSETQIVKHDGNTFKIIASKNKMELAVIKGPKKGNGLDLVYTPENQSWNAVKSNGEIIKLASFEEGFYIVYMPNGEHLKISAMESRENGLALLNEKTTCYYLDGMMAEAN